MELHLVPGLGGSSGGGGGGVEPDRLTEAEQLVRRTRQRLEELADRLAELRRKIGGGSAGNLGTPESGEPHPPEGGARHDARHPVADEPSPSS